MASFERALEKSVEYFGGDELAAHTFVSKYALRDASGILLEETPEDMHHRLAKEFARIEANYPNPMSEEEIFGLLDRFEYVVPQGSPQSGIGNPYQVQSISNCFVVDSPHDSYGGILHTDQELVQIMKRRGGVGLEVSTIRPKGMPTSNAAKTTDGIGIFMERFSNSCREVAQGGRRGAEMITCDGRHPEIETFINIKRDLKKVTGANISAKIYDDFMEAVEDGTNYTLRWPVNAAVPDVTKTVMASSLWDQIIDSAWTSAEPGVLFWDNVKRNTPTECYADLGFGCVSTNPCGEIVLSPYDSCRLLLVNLASFVRLPFTENASIDWELFGVIVQKAQRLMDDIVDLELEQIEKILAKIESDPEPDHVKRTERELWQKIRNRAQQGRRTGLGVTAVGDMVAYMGLRYGSDESISLVEEIYRQLAINSYKSSCIMAGERGAFPIFRCEREVNHPFIQKILSEDSALRNLYTLHGRRNIANLTTAPAGSVSLETQTTSGIEPTIFIKSVRRKKINANDSVTRVDHTDAMGDRWQEYEVFHHGVVKWMKVTGETDITKSPYWNATAEDIDWVQRVKLQAAAQKWVCHSISSTVNLPKETTRETVKEIYMAAWKAGCKGVTVYRDGCRDQVIRKAKDTPVAQVEDQELITESTAPKRPKELPCHIVQANVKGEKWTILVGLLDGRPYEVMGGLSKYVEIPRKHKTGKLVKNGKRDGVSTYNLHFGEGEDAGIVKDIVNTFENANFGAFTRLLSTSLRHGTPVQFIVEQLGKDKDSDMFSFSRVIARVLKSHIADGTKVTSEKECPSCHQDALRYQEGCVTCTSCGFSKCS
jgi:ribonucleoside-diphosphate reductase alpha chain